MTIYKRVLGFIAGAVATWAFLALTLYMFTDGMWWAVRSGAMAGAFVILAGSGAMLLAIMSFYCAIYAITSEG